MNDVIEGKRILFFAPAFFGYERVLTEKMIQMGASVDFYDVRSVSSTIERALLKISPSFFPRKTKKYYEKIIRENENKEYDYVLFIKCDMTPVRILEKMRVVFNKAKFCLYLWDSVRNIKGIEKKFKYFDSIYSFDSIDCKNNRLLKLRPLFYSDQFASSLSLPHMTNYDISFIGTIHSDRYAIIRDIKRIAKENGLSCFWHLYLQSHFIFWFYKIMKKEFRGVSKSVFSFEKLSFGDVKRIVDDSRIILDINHPRQTGLTIRTIEMIGMKKKIITTNANIRDYDFYNPNNICIVDRLGCSIPDHFFDSPYQELPDGIYKRYSINQWIIDVLK